MHYLKYLHISINHRLTKANFKKDGERDNLLPVPSAIKFILLLDAKDTRLTFCCCPPQMTDIGSAHHQHSHLSCSCPSQKSAEVVPYSTGNLLLCPQSRAMGCWASLCPGLPPCSLIFPLLAPVAFGAEQLKSPWFPQAQLYHFPLPVDFASSEMGNPVLPKNKC